MIYHVPAVMDKVVGSTGMNNLLRHASVGSTTSLKHDINIVTWTCNNEMGTFCRFVLAYYFLHVYGTGHLLRASERNEK